MKRNKDMAKELKKWNDSVYALRKNGRLDKIRLKSLLDYDHGEYDLHHYIQYQAYVKNPKWYKDHGIEQKLILMSIKCHEQVELRAIKTLRTKNLRINIKFHVGN
ncbi:MAG: hypothetical protein K6E29_09275 [Cyanobacteria bacterium RUI128]|nr:hypothetical protein [Cyanobacteria bacterium RUI128]